MRGGLPHGAAAREPKSRANRMRVHRWKQVAVIGCGLAAIVTSSVSAQALIVGGGGGLPGVQGPVTLQPQFPTPVHLPASAGLGLPPVSVTPPAAVPSLPPATHAPIPDSYTTFSLTNHNSDGSNTTVVHDTPAYRHTASGWAPIDPSVQSRIDLAHPLSAENGLRPIRFGITSSDLVELALDKGPVTLSAPGLNIGQPSAWLNGVLHSNVATDTDLRYRVSSSGFQEQLLLRSSSAPTSFTFHLSDPQGQLGSFQPTEDGGYLFSGEIDGLKIKLQPAAAYESTGAPGSMDLIGDPRSAHETLVRAGDGFDITETLDASWLQGRQFPIVFDPSMTYVDGNTQYAMSFQASPGCGGGCGSRNNGWDLAVADYAPNWIWMRSYFRYDLSNIPVGSTLTSGNFDASVVSCWGGHLWCSYDGGGGFPIWFARMTDSWQVGDSWDSLNNKNAYDATGGAPGTAFASYPQAAFSNPCPPSPNTCGNVSSDFTVPFPYGTGGLQQYQNWVNNPTCASNNPQSNCGFATWMNPDCPSQACQGPTWENSIASCSSGGSVCTNGGHDVELTMTWNPPPPPPAPTITKSIVNPQTLYTVGQALTYQLAVTNPGSAPITVSNVSDSLPTGLTAASDSLLPGSTNVVQLNGGVCPTQSGSITCSLSATQFTAGNNFQLGAGASVTFTFPAVVTGVGDRQCSQLSNTASVASSTGNVTSNVVPITVCDVGLGYENWWTYVNQSLGAGGKASVNVANGNVVVQYTDSTPVQAHGRFAYVLRRTYNSEDTANWAAANGLSPPVLNIAQAAPIGAGWRLNVDEVGNGANDGVSPSALEVPSVQSLLDSAFDVTLIDEDGTHHVYTPQAITANVGAGVQLAPIDVTPLNGVPAIPATSDLVPLLSKVIKTVDSAKGYTNLCVDETFNSPAGVHLAMWRYIEVNGGCNGPSSTPIPAVVGFAAMRPDRVRYEFSLDGHLLDVTDGAGVDLKYNYLNVPTGGAPVTVPVGHLTSVYEPRSCPPNPVVGSPTCRGFVFTYPTSGTETDVTDPGGRTTQYVLNGNNQLAQVKNVQAGTTYTYAYGQSGCAGSGSATGQLCAATDLISPNPNVTNFSYGPAAGGLGMQRAASITDRRSSVTSFTYSNGSSAVTCGTTGTQTTDWVTADRSSEEQRFACIDTTGTVGELDAGAPGGGSYLHRTLNFWDTAGSQCIQGQAVAAPDHDLCRTFQFGMESGLPASSSQNNGLGPAVPWSNPADTSSTYNPEGQLLISSACVNNVDPTGASLPALCPQANVTTYGYAAGYVMGDKTLVTGISDGPTGGGAVNSVSRPAPTTHGGVMYALSDATASLTPNGNAAGSSYASFLTQFADDANYSVDPNTVVPGVTSGTSTTVGPSFCSAANSETNSGLRCSMQTPAGTTRYAFDTYGQRVSMTTPNGGGYSYTYCLDTGTDLSGKTQAGGWLNAVTDPAGNFVAYAYDEAGNQVRTWQRNATQGDTISQFPCSTAAPVNSQYSETDYAGGANPFVTPWRYVMARRDALGNQTTYTRDGNGNQLTTKDPLGSVTTQAFDAGDELVSHLTPVETNYQGSGQNYATTYTFDAFGNNVSQTNPNGVVTVFTYDTVNRLTSTEYTLGLWPTDTSTVPSACRQSASSDAPISSTPPRILCTTSTQYDGVDNKVWMIDGNGQPTYQRFDGLHRVVKMIGPRQVGGGGTTTMNLYDLDGNTIWTCSPREFTEGSAQCINYSPYSNAIGHQDYSTAHTYDAMDRQIGTITFRQSGPNVSTFQADATVTAYDADGNVASQTDANIHMTRFTFDLLDRRISKGVPRDASTTETTTWTYDPSGNTVSESVPATGTQGQAATSHITVHTYDADNRVLDTITGADSTNPTADGPPDAAGGRNIRTRSVYDADGDVVGTYDPRAFTSSVTSPDVSFLTTVVYDADKRPVAQVVPRWNGTTASDPTASAQGSLEMEQCPTAPAFNHYFILPDGTYLLVTIYGTAIGLCVTGADYDHAGNRIHLYPPGYMASRAHPNQFLALSYTDDKRVSTVDSPDPSAAIGSSSRVQTSTAYDAVGNPVRVADPLGDQQRTTYLPDNLVASASDALNNTTTYGYDASGNRTLVTEPVGTRTATQYYSDNLQEFITNGAQDTSGDQFTGAVKNTTANSYDALGNLASVFSPSAWARHAGSSYADGTSTAGTPTANSYTADNLLLTTRQPVAADGSTLRETDYTYGGSGLKLSQHVYLTNSSGGAIAGDDGGTQTLQYYPDSRLAAQASPSGETISTLYDPAANPIQVADSSGGAVLTGTYYLDGLPRTVNDGSVTTEYSNDGAGQRTADDQVGNTSPSKTASTVADSTSFNYNDAELRVFASANIHSINDLQSFGYDKAGRTVRETTPGGSLTVGYNANNTLAYQDLSTSNYPTAADWTYSYDANSRVTQGQFSGIQGGQVPSSLCYAYDGADRLQSAYSGSCVTSPAQNVTWDHNGNRLTYSSQVGSTSASQAFTYNADNSVASEATNGGTPRQYTESPAGDVTSDGCSNYVYDGFDRLTAATSAGSPCSGAATATYSYDPLDRERTFTQAATTQVQHYDGWTKATASVARSTDNISYELSPGGQPLQVVQGSSTSQDLFDDGQGNIATAMSQSGSVDCAVRYDPFGNPLSPGSSAAGSPNPCNTGGTPNTYFYKGARQDPATGDYAMGSRLYDPKKDAFLTPDTYRTGPPKDNPSVGADPLTLNTYAYVNGDPVNFSDPTGHRYECGSGGDPVCTGIFFPRASAATKQSALFAESQPNTTSCAGCGSQAPGSDCTEMTGPGWAQLNAMNAVPLFAHPRNGMTCLLPRMAAEAATGIGAEGAGGVLGKLFGALHGAPGGVTDALTPSASGDLIGWGTGQSSAAVAQTESVAANLSAEQVAGWARSGLSREWVQANLKQYQEALTSGTRAAQNVNLAPRIALMQKILDLWPS